MKKEEKVKKEEKERKVKKLAGAVMYGLLKSKIFDLVMERMKRRKFIYQGRKYYLIKNGRHSEVKAVRR